MPRIARVAALTGGLLLIWSTLFASTFRYPFYWDDFHLIRSYSGAEIRSAFHAVIDPDKIETPGLRPCSIFLYNFQGFLFGENIVAQRVFMVVLMALFMIAAGTLLLEVGLSFVQLGIVFVLFVSSRTFASLVLWISLSHLIMAYIWIVLTAYFFVLWTRRGCWWFFVATLIASILATFTREETYTLPVVLPILWLISSSDRRQWRRVVTAAVSLLVIVCFHYWLWHFLVPNALSPQISFPAAKRLARAMGAAWLPCGRTWIGVTDTLMAIVWIAFSIALLFSFLWLANRHRRWQFLGVCSVGALLSLPALGIARPFGIALPTLTFMSAISIAIGEVYKHTGTEDWFRKWWHEAVLSSIIVGFAVGIVSGIHRSKYVAESIQENSVTRVARDGEFLFNLLDHPATIPAPRRQAGLARLRRFGIKSADDLKSMQTKVNLHPEEFRHESSNAGRLLLAKYDYLSL
jgi:hypothetical protein